MDYGGYRGSIAFQRFFFNSSNHKFSIWRRRGVFWLTKFGHCGEKCCGRMPFRSKPNMTKYLGAIFRAESFPATTVRPLHIHKSSQPSAKYVTISKGHNELTSNIY